jgi:hypothetical protein
MESDHGSAYTPILGDQITFGSGHPADRILKVILPLAIKISLILGVILNMPVETAEAIMVYGESIPLNKWSYS